MIAYCVNYDIKHGTDEPNSENYNNIKLMLTESLYVNVEDKVFKNGWSYKAALSPCSSSTIVILLDEKSEYDVTEAVANEMRSFIKDTITDINQNLKKDLKLSAYIAFEIWGPQSQYPQFFFIDEEGEEVYY